MISAWGVDDGSVSKGLPKRIPQVRAMRNAKARAKAGGFFDGAAAGEYQGTRDKMAALHIPHQAEAHLKAWTRGEK